MLQLRGGGPMRNRCTCHGKRIRGHGGRWPKDRRILRHENTNAHKRDDVSEFTRNYIKKQRLGREKEAWLKDMAILEDLHQRAIKVRARQQLSPLFYGGLPYAYAHPGRHGIRWSR